MTCKEFAEFLDEYIGGSLPAESRLTFEQHLSVCRDCRNYLDSYRRTMAAEKAAFARTDEGVSAAVPEGLVKAVMEARRAKG